MTHHLFESAKKPVLCKSAGLDITVKYEVLEALCHTNLSSVGIAVRICDHSSDTASVTKCHAHSVVHDEEANNNNHDRYGRCRKVHFCFTA